MLNVLTAFDLFDSLYYVAVFLIQIAIIVGLIFLVRKLLKRK
ncbi:hypothetical protein [Levilactobacillus acidifarinae]|nr:hypothetical protein [Levilactobacillus acidifarinae]GEO70379.1 hypothetical protein LAC03_22890 [Levilactobacillus acidifarinae]